MGLIHAKDLKKDMVLACEVSNKHGNTLLEKGETLSEKHIMLLKSWGITEADIEGFDRGQVEERERETLSTAVVESIEEDLKNNVVFFLEVEEQDEGIKSKKEMIADAIVKAKAKAIALEQNGLFTDQAVNT